MDEPAKRVKMSAGGASKTQTYLIPTVIGVVASGIWWGITLNWIAAGSAFLGIVVISIILRLSMPFLLKIQQFESSEISDIFENQAAAEADIRRSAIGAKQIDILTIRGLGIIGLNDSVLRKQLFDTTSHRCKIRVLLLSPHGNQASHRAAEVGESREAFAHGINLAIQRMKELDALKHHEVEVYLYDRQPCWRIISLDGTQYISMFGRKIEGHRAKMYKIDGTKNSTLHEGFSRMFEEMCQSAEKVIGVQNV
jgi:hypothetical protein